MCDSLKVIVTKQASSKCYTKCVKLLQKNGAVVNKATTNGWTSLMVACLVGNKNTVQLLLQSGANVNPALPTVWTPLLTAVVSDAYDCARSLIKAGANVNVEIQSYCLDVYRRRRGEKMHWDSLWTLATFRWSSCYFSLASICFR